VILELSNNQISEIPCQVTNLKSLVNLWLDDNQLKELPLCITTLVNLTDIAIRRNPLNNPEKYREFLHIGTVDF
jgi:Leucine-rich repeat (LRR) protein